MNAFSKKYPKTHRFLQGAGKAIQVAGSALSLATTIASVINAEHKHLDTLSGVISCSNSTPNVTCLTNMAQGTTDQTRTGNSVLSKHVYLKGSITRSAARDAGAVDLVRVMLIIDTNDVADTAPTIDLILQNYSTTYSAVSPHNKAYTDRFKVLYDKSFALSEQTPLKMIKLYKQFKTKTYTNKKGKAVIRALHQTYNGPNSTDLSKNHIYVVSIGSNNTSPPDMAWHARFGYVDN